MRVAELHIWFGKTFEYVVHIVNYNETRICWISLFPTPNLAGFGNRFSVGIIDDGHFKMHFLASERVD